MKKAFVVLLLAVVSIPATLWAQQKTWEYQRFQNQRRVEQTTSTMRQLIVALAFYGQEHSDKLPPMKSMATLKASFPPYYMAKNSFASPITGLPFVLNKSASLTGRTFRSLPSTTVLFYDTKPLAGYNSPRQMIRVVGYKDHIIAMPESQWQRTKKDAGIR